MATICLRNALKRLIAFPREIQLLPYRQYAAANLLRPKRTKYKKFQKRLRNVKPAKPDHVEVPPLHFFDHGLYALESIRVTAAQIESARVTLQRTLGRGKARIRLCVFPHIPVTKKALGVRMGKGKGNVDHFVAFVKAGKMLFEFSKSMYAKKAHKAVSYKLPIKIGYVEKKLPKDTPTQLS